MKLAARHLKSTIKKKYSFVGLYVVSNTDHNTKHKLFSFFFFLFFRLILVTLVIVRLYIYIYYKVAQFISPSCDGVYLTFSQSRPYTLPVERMVARRRLFSYWIWERLPVFVLHINVYALGLILILDFRSRTLHGLWCVYTKVHELSTNLLNALV